MSKRIWMSGLGVAVAGGLTVSAGAASVTVDFELNYNQTSIDFAERTDDLTLPTITGNVVYDSDFVNASDRTELDFGNGLTSFSLSLDPLFTANLDESSNGEAPPLFFDVGPTAIFTDGEFQGVKARAIGTLVGPIEILFGTAPFAQGDDFLGQFIIASPVANGQGTIAYDLPDVPGDDGMEPDIDDGNDGDDGDGMDVDGDDGGGMDMDGDAGNGGPNVIPSPTAAAAGLMLLGLGAVRRRRGA